MRWHSQRERDRAVQAWHDWFAWHPVRLGESDDYMWAWLEVVERKSTRWTYELGTGDVHRWVWDYRAKRKESSRG